jgi:signal transduction histidine kinase
METSAIIQLLRKMGHDMRVPLNTLISTSDMLVQGVYDPLTPKQAKAASRLQRSSYRLLAILDDFVTYVKAETGDLTLTPKPFDPRVQLETWCGTVRPAAEEKGLTLHVTTSEDVPEAVNGDEAMLKRVVEALVWNAVSFTVTGEVRVSSDWAASGEWRISVQDSGPGIPESDLPHIFEPFWRGEERPQVPTAGAGLGLPVARALARLMGGNVSLKETGSGGSRFYVEIPPNRP